MNIEIKSVPFSWNDNFSEEALEDFQQIQKNLSYGVCQSIGLALAKLELLEKQGCKVEVEIGVDVGDKDECAIAWMPLPKEMENEG